MRLNLGDIHLHMIQVPGTEEDPALSVAIGVDGVLGKTALQVKGALQCARTGVGKAGVRTLLLSAQPSSLLELTSHMSRLVHIQTFEQPVSTPVSQHWEAMAGGFTLRPGRWLRWKKVPEHQV